MARRYSKLFGEVGAKTGTGKEWGKKVARRTNTPPETAHATTPAHTLCTAPDTPPISDEMTKCASDLAAPMESCRSARMFTSLQTKNACSAASRIFSNNHSNVK